jgi:hypothetical protein
MRQNFVFWLALVGALSLPCPALGFKLSPCLRALTLEDGRLGQDGMRLQNLCPYLLPEQFKSAVHEHMTLATIKAYRGGVDIVRTRKGWRYEYMTEAPWPTKLGRMHFSRGIMFGNWWNDDPLMLTWGQSWDIIGGSLVATRFLKDGYKQYPSAGCDVVADQHLGRWSHFGPLQHLHFMTNMKRSGSNPEQRIVSTTDLALSWMKFAYRVAIGDLKPQDMFTEELERQAGLPSVALNHCVQDRANVKIRTLFTLRDPTWTDTYRRSITPEVALGTMLHVIQDSFSPAHTCRVRKKADDGVYAVIADVENYNEQIHDSHGDLDNYPDWLVERVHHGTEIYKNDPVTVGAWLLLAVDTPLPWKQVEDHLRRTIFASGGSGSSSTECIGGRANKK